eukprot:TRINITY_DN14350_c1_g5_i1.p1 TRINITY_DN14350_c1_g5~~TRINITY_DN14350_c1_g5_i1.p1  ORF type:complete len:817 (-),score=160.47 TRINITY_DN14350_c1_g5_i1:271-2376(-)
MVHLDHSKEDSDSGEEDNSENSESAAGRWLRKACAGLNKADVTAVEEYLNSLDSEVATRIVRQGNRNGKTALHLASQMRRRTDEEGAVLVELLIRYGADVSVSTRRGHTPLIFASARGHNHIVQTLLRHGANPRVIVVSGGLTAVTIGQGRLDEKTHAMLKAAEAASNEAWKDFRNNSDAVKAQLEHTRAYKSAQNAKKEEEKKEKTKQAMLVERYSQELQKAFALELPAALEEISHIVVNASARGGLRDAFERALRSVISGAGLHDPLVMSKALNICQETRIQEALHERGHRDRRSMRSILSAVLAELRSKPELLDTIPAAALIDETDCPFALEVLLLKRSYSKDDQSELEQFWQKLLEFQSQNDWAPEVSNIVKPQLAKREGGIIVTQLFRRLRFACHMETATPLWKEMVTSVADEAAQTGRASHLFRAAKNYFLEVPDDVREILQDAASRDVSARSNQFQGLVGHDVKAPLAEADVASLSEYKLSMDYLWVSSDERVGTMQAEIQDALNGCSRTKKRLHVGVDTEWGEEGDGKDCVPSVVQIALKDKAWVVDTARPTPAVRSFFRWLFSQEKVAVLGFAFGSDSEKIVELMSDADGASAIPEIHVIDLQILAMKHISKKGYQPGLKTVTEAWLGVTLDKTQQCSDWDKRPLSAEQLRYAAADAVVLIDIAAAMGLDQTAEQGDVDLGAVQAPQWQTLT